MALRVSNLRVPVDEPDANLPGHIARAIGVRADELSGWRVLRKSLDLRDKRQLRFVYNFEVAVPEEELEVVYRTIDRAAPTAQVELYDDPPFEMATPGTEALRERPVVIGSGPAGLICAYFLALHGYRPIVLERGTKVSDRIRDVKTFDGGGHFEPESNYLFGEGGAGTFSDGKLTCRGSGPDVLRVLELFAECKGQQPGKPSILYYHRPHLGSNRLPAVVKAIRQKIENLGGEVRFHTKVEDIDCDATGVRGVHTTGGFIPASVVILAVGHSARDTFEMLVRRGVPMSQKAFQFGVRVEHPQAVVNEVQYGPAYRSHEASLGNADYSLVAAGKNRTPDVFTFCMCAGGSIIPSVSQTGYFCTNGMSLSKRDSEFANSGLVVTVPVEAFGGPDVLAGVRLQEKYEKRAYELGRGNYGSPLQTARDFLAGKVGATPRSSYPREGFAADLREVLPPVVVEALINGLPQMDKRWGGRFLKDAVLAGPESRGSSPVASTATTSPANRPACRGSTPSARARATPAASSGAAVDGLRTARALIARFAAIDAPV